MKRFLLAVVLAALFVAGATAAVIPGIQHNAKFGPFCISTQNGLIHAVKTQQPCKKKEVRVKHVVDLEKLAALLAGLQAQIDKLKLTPGPAGPQGGQGPQGPAGANGTNGSNGTNGTNGAAGASVTVTTGSTGSTATSTVTSTVTTTTTQTVTVPGGGTCTSNCGGNNNGGNPDCTTNCGGSNEVAKT